jgi:hypothetical protein
MNAQLPPRTHNNPPDPLDEALAPYGDYLAEAEGWLDGTPVETEAQMRAVDALLRQIKAADKAVTDAQKSESAPLHDAWKAALARYKPTLDDLDRIKRGLVAAVDGFKRRLAAQKAEAERLAREQAAAAARAAAEAHRAALDSDLEAQRAAAAMQAEAEAAQIAAARASRDADSVKGLRTVTKHVVEDHRAALHWIAKNDRDAITAFVEDYARRHHAQRAIDGVRVWKEKAAF